MRKTRSVSAFVLWFLCATAFAQDYPTKTIRIIVPLSAGGGMDSIARGLAREKILAYCIAPGFVETAMARNDMEERRSEIEADIPLGRVATVEDVAGVALFLASDDADYLTGVTIPVTGGSWMTT